MSSPVNKIVIVGGGAAGWLTAGILAAKFQQRYSQTHTIELVESPAVGTIGVGEGTWPSMRLTLQKIGIPEKDLISFCNASFKQGSKFVGWKNVSKKDEYYHPFTLNPGFYESDLHGAWMQKEGVESFAKYSCAQVEPCELNLAPKQLQTPEYASVLNYGYHLDSHLFGELLKEHCTKRLGVVYTRAHIKQVNVSEIGDIASLLTDSGVIEGDFFVDCSGSKGLLIGDALGVDWTSQSKYLFNDSALAVQVPYVNENDPILSVTKATAQDQGWIWDIGLSSRRGVGHVFSSSHSKLESIEQDLKGYLKQSLSDSAINQLNFRAIKFNPGHRKVFWERNCIAIGMSSGFIEPLEASALALIEAGADMLAANFPASRDVMPICSKRYNERMHHYWKQIIEFLKLHYLFTENTDLPYWRDASAKESVPNGLSEKLMLWATRAPNLEDFDLLKELFPAASYQYVLYGLGFNTAAPTMGLSSYDLSMSTNFHRQTKDQARRCVSGLPTNRDLINQIKARASAA